MYIVVAVKFAIMGSEKSAADSAMAVVFVNTESKHHDACSVVATIFAIMGSGRTRVLSAKTLFAPLRDAWIMVTNFLAHGLCVIT